MKQVTLILIFILATFTTSCIYSEEECPGYMRFTFLSEGSPEGFEDKIANDIHLRIYKDDILYQSGIIAYEKIKEGTEYRIRKDITGEIDIVAWAIPRQEDFVGNIPSFSLGQSTAGELLEMSSATRVNATHEPMGHLYLGTFTHYEDKLMEDTYYNVDMKSCIAEFSATLHNVPDLFEKGEEDLVWLMVRGTRTQMDMHFQPQGEEARVVAVFKEKEDDKLTTLHNGLLPSDDDQYLAVDIYKENSFRGTIQTDIQARPGDIIHLDIQRNMVVIHINGWRIFDTTVEWI